MKTRITGSKRSSPDASHLASVTASRDDSSRHRRL
jgi:hypothetical protein